jgi:thiol:disulfide interchange protein DsbA
MKSRIIFILLTVILLSSCQKEAFDSIEVNGKVYISGTDYAVLDQRLNFGNATSANVMEFFWYGCPHCQVFEDDLQSWLGSLPAGIRFGRIPAVWNEAMFLHARAFYTAKELGLLDAIHKNLFVRIIATRANKDLSVQRQRISTLFQQQGIPKHQFASVFDSDRVTKQVGAGINLAKVSKVSSTPSFLVNGKYVLTGSAFKSRTELLAVVDALMQREIDNHLVDWW